MPHPIAPTKRVAGKSRMRMNLVMVLRVDVCFFTFSFTDVAFVQNSAFSFIPFFENRTSAFCKLENKVAKRASQSLQREMN
jgi:hypothetical protein